MAELNIFSMFDGVGGFTIGFDNADNEYYQTLYSNQYEPSRKTQDAFEVGKYRFPDMEHIGIDVAEIPDEKFQEMKENGVNMIVGGFLAKTTLLPIQVLRVSKVRRVSSLPDHSCY